MGYFWTDGYEITSFFLSLLEVLVRPLGYSEPAGTELFALGMRQGCANELYATETEGLVLELTLKLCPG